MSYKLPPQRANKFKERDTYSIKRVDMSQYLPKLEFPGPKKKTIDIKSPRSKSQNVKPRRVLLNDELSKKYGYHPIENKGNTTAKPNLPFGSYKLSSYNYLNNDKQQKGLGQGSQASIQDAKREQNKLYEYEYFRQKSKTEVKVDPEGVYEKSKNKLNKSEIKEAGQFKMLEHMNASQDENTDDEATDHAPYFGGERLSTEEIKREEEEHPPIKEEQEEKEGFTEKELAEYAFLNQAKSINIFRSNSDDFEKIDISMQAYQKENKINAAINILKEAYENTQYPENMIEELDIILDCNYKEMKIAIDFSELSDLFCELVDNISLDLTRKLKIFSFLYYFCEDALFSLNLDFNLIYNKITQVTHKLLNTKEHLLSVDKGLLKKNLNKAFLYLHKYFAKEVYLIEREKTEIIIKNFLEIMTFNLDLLYEDIPPESKFFNMDRIIPLFSVFGDEYIEIFKLLFKRAEAREYIIRDIELSKKLIYLLNSLNQVINISSVWSFDHLKEKNKQAVLQYNLNCFDLYLTVFKYFEMFQLLENPDLSLQRSVGDVLIEMINWLGRIMMKSRLFTLLFERSHESHDTPKTSHGIVSGSGIANLMDSFKQFLNNFKLFEQEKLDYEKLLYKLIEFLTQIQDLIKSQRLQTDFEMFVQAVLKNPFRKLANRIVKNLNLVKGGNYFSKDPLSSIS